MMRKASFRNLSLFFTKASPLYLKPLAYIGFRALIQYFDGEIAGF